jgi:glycosyltransferase involved in cell wall biosynthesis
MRKTVSVLLPTKDRPQVLPIVLMALSFQTYTSFEVIIRDESQKCSAITNDPVVSQTIDLLANRVGSPVKYIRDVHSKGIAWARKQLLSQSDTDLVWFVDDDVAPEPDCLAKLVDTYNKRDAGFVQGAKINVDNICGYSDHRNGIVETDPAIDTSIFLRYATDATLPITCGDTANLLFNRTRLIDAGGFDFALELPGALRCEDWIATVQVSDRHDCFFRTAAIGWHLGVKDRGEWLYEQYKIALAYLSTKVSVNTYKLFQKQMNLE